MMWYQEMFINGIPFLCQSLVTIHDSVCKATLHWQKDKTIEKNKIREKDKGKEEI